MEVVSVMWGRCGTHEGGECDVGGAGVGPMEVVNIMWGWCGCY